MVQAPPKPSAYITCPKCNSSQLCDAAAGYGHCHSADCYYAFTDSEIRAARVKHASNV